MNQPQEALTVLNPQTLDVSGQLITKEKKHDIQHMMHLRVLYLNDTNVSNLNFLTPLSNLEELDLSGTAVYDLSALRSLTHLKKLTAHDTAIHDLTPLASLKELQTIEMERAHIFDVAPLEHCSKLEILDFYGNETLEDLSPLSTLTHLQELTVKNTGIHSPRSLQCLLNLKSLKVLNVDPELEEFAQNVLHVIGGRSFSQPPKAATSPETSAVSLETGVSLLDMAKTYAQHHSAQQCAELLRALNEILKPTLNLPPETRYPTFFSG